MSKLQPPKNYREVVPPKSCYNCAYRLRMGTHHECWRDPEIRWLETIQTKKYVCDGHKKSRLEA